MPSEASVSYVNSSLLYAFAWALKKQVQMRVKEKSLEVVMLNKVVELAGGRAHVKSSEHELSLFCATLHNSGASSSSVAKALKISHRKASKLALQHPRDAEYCAYRDKLAMKVLEADMKGAERRSKRGRKGAQAKPKAGKKAPAKGLISKIRKPMAPPTKVHKSKKRDLQDDASEREWSESNERDSE